LKCGKLRFIEVVNEDGESVMTELVIRNFVTCLLHLG
jgi:hypothetical protein